MARLATSGMGQIFSTLSSLIAKAAYTGFLVLAIVLLMRFVWNLWASNQIVLGDIAYIKDAELNPDRASALTEEIVDHRNVVMALVNELVITVKEQQIEQKSIHAIYQSLLSGVALDELETAANSIPEVKLSIQGNDLGPILSALRSWISPKNAMQIRVFERDHVSYSIKWPRTHSMIGIGHVRRGLRSNFVVENQLGASLGCRILWLELTEKSASLANVPPDAFCRWVRSRQLMEVAEDMSAIGENTEKVEETLLSAIQIIEPLVGSVGSFPPLQNLYSVLLVKLPKSDERKINYAELNLAQVLDGGAPISFDQFVADIDVVAENIDGAVAVGASCSAGDLVGVIGAKIGLVKVTANAVVADRDGGRFLLLPDYAFSGGANEVYSLQGRDETGGAEAQIGELEQIFSAERVALVRLNDECKADNFAGGEPLSGVQSPHKGQLVFVLSNNKTSQNSARVSSSTLTTNSAKAALIGNAEMGFELDKQLFGAGEGGAPLVDENNMLIGMAYSSGTSTSYGIALEQFLNERGLELMKQAGP